MKRGNAAGTVATLALTCIFGVTLLMGIFAGASVYQRVGDRVDRSAQDRVGLTYLTAKVRAFDQKLPDGTSAVRVGTLEGRDALYLLESIDGVDYETILYVYDGQLREMLCLRGNEQGAAFGEVITQAQALKADFPKEGLLRLDYVGGDGETRTADIWLRSGGDLWKNG